MRGESEAAQYLFRVEQDSPEFLGLSSARAELVGVPDGVDCKLYQVGFVKTDSNFRVEGSGGGWRPDPLLLLNEDDTFDVPVSSSQPMWISCAASPSAAEGTTNMMLQLHFNVGTLETRTCAHIRMQVLPISVPSLKDSTIGSAWSGAWEQNNFVAYYGQNFSWADSQDKWYSMMLNHRTPPDSIYLQKPRPLDDYLYLAKNGVKWFALVDVSNYKGGAFGASLLQVDEGDHPANLHHDNANGKGRWMAEASRAAHQEGFSMLEMSSGVEKRGCPEFYTEAGIQRLIDILRPTVEGLEKHGILDRAYVYGFDEKGPECEGEIRKVFSATKKAFPKLMTHAVLNWSPMPVDLPVDIWTIAFDKFNPRDAQEWIKAGKVQWHYHCIEPSKSVFLNSFIERPTVQARLLFWLAALNQLKYGAPSGWLYWAMDYWRPCDSPLCGQQVKPKILERTSTGMMKNTAFTDFPPANYIWKPDMYNIFANGDGQFVYPCKDGPCGSIRLDALQDGLEDWELFQMLGPEKGIPLLEKIVQSPTSFNSDAYEVERVRREALSLLMEKQDKPQDEVEKLQDELQGAAFLQTSVLVQADGGIDDHAAVNKA